MGRVSFASIFHLTRMHSSGRFMDYYNLWGHDHRVFYAGFMQKTKMGSDGDKADMDGLNRNSNVSNSDHHHHQDIASDSEDGRISRQASCYETENDEELAIQLGPKCSIKEHLEKDKDDESLRRWKEQLLGSVDAIAVQENLEPDVKIMSLTILSPGRPETVLEIPENGNIKGLWFTIKEGSPYKLRFTIKVSNEIVCGLKYINTVWKTGIKVDSSKQMLGTFSPQSEPYTHEIAEDIAPSGIFARGSYSAKTKFVDDDNKCYLDINYTFDIQKDWASK